MPALDSRFQHDLAAGVGQVATHIFSSAQPLRRLSALRRAPSVRHRRWRWPAAGACVHPRRSKTRGSPPRRRAGARASRASHPRTFARAPPRWSGTRAPARAGTARPGTGTARAGDPCAKKVIMSFYAAPPNGGALGNLCTQAGSRLVLPDNWPPHATQRSSLLTGFHTPQLLQSHSAKPQRCNGSHCQQSAEAALLPRSLQCLPVTSASTRSCHMQGSLPRAARLLSVFPSPSPPLAATKLKAPGKCCIQL